MGGDKNSKKEIVLTGIPVSEGIALGNICIYRTEMDDIFVYQIEPSQISDEMERYFSALNDVGMQFMEKQNRIARHIGTKRAEIYDAYRMILDDPVFQEEIPTMINQQKENAESVIRKELMILEKRFAEIEDEYLRERIYDIRGVSRRLIFNLMQKDSFCDFDREKDNILIARELTPVDSIYFQHRALKGIATEYGGKTSHAAILAHSLEIAAVVGVKDLIRHIQEVRTAVIDGFNGKIILYPARETMEKTIERIEIWQKQRERFQSAVSVPTPRIAGKQIRLYVNINDENEIRLAQKYQAEGVGLFRTELQFIAKERLLTENEQFEIYREVVTAFPGRNVTIRLLDMGGDKFMPFADRYHELNPFLGWRSIRILLSDTDMFRTQVRAMLRASDYGRVRILIPMVSSLEDVLAVKSVIADVAKEMNRPPEKTPLGVMVEIPSAALNIDSILRVVEFASIGTNDLVQYTLAVDRNNEKVANYYQPLNAAVLDLIARVAGAGKKLKKEVSICGEIAGDPLYVPLLVALGLNQLSMHPAALPRVKNLLMRLPEKVINHLAKNYRRFETANELMDYLRSVLQQAEKLNNS